MSAEAITLEQADIEAQETPDEIQARRLDDLADLEQREVNQRKYARRVDSWRSARYGSWLPAILCTVAFIAPPTSHELNLRDRSGIWMGTFIGSMAAFLVSDKMRRTSFGGRREEAEGALPIYERLGLRPEPWVFEALQPDKDPNPYEPPKETKANV